MLKSSPGRLKKKVLNALTALSASEDALVRAQSTSNTILNSLKGVVSPSSDGSPLEAPTTASELSKKALKKQRKKLRKIAEAQAKAAEKQAGELSPFQHGSPEAAKDVKPIGAQDTNFIKETEVKETWTGETWKEDWGQDSE